jgi:hypothetical protein
MKEEIEKLRSEGKTYREISEIVGCSKSTASYYCGIDQKQKTRIRSNKNKTDFCECGNKKSKISLKCYPCVKKDKRKSVLDKTLESLPIKNSGRYALVRKYARITLNELKIEKKCKVCNFSYYVEVCHVKAISSFSQDTKISVINDPTNLIYLCPNHHILLDKGIIKL